MNTTYRKSSYSGVECVEVAPPHNGMVSLRNSRDLGMPAHEFTAAEWAAFISGAKDGEFDFGLDLPIASAQTHPERTWLMPTCRRLRSMAGFGLASAPGALA